VVGSYFGRTFFAPAYYAGGYWRPDAVEPPVEDARRRDGMYEQARIWREQDDEAAAWLLLSI